MAEAQVTDDQSTPAQPEHDGDIQTELLSQVPEWQKEIKATLPALPDDIAVEFDNRYLITDTGTGGFAVSRDRIKLAFDPNFPGDREEQIADLKAINSHESFHIVQNYVGDNPALDGIPAIEHAIYEGAATKFEMLRVGSNPGRGQYPADRQTILDWFNEVKSLPKDFDFDKWKFYDPETDRRWILYRVGTFIIDEVLRHNPELAIEDLATRSPQEILELSKLSL